MKKPKEPIKPRKPPEPNKMLPPRKERFGLYSGISLAEILNGVNGADPHKVCIDVGYGYYDSLEIEAVWTNENPGKNPHYETQLKRYKNALVDYEVKIKEYEKLKAQYDRDQKEYLVAFHKEELAKLERKVGKAK